MKKIKKSALKRKKLIRYAARSLAAIYILFISLFALDSFSGEVPFYLELVGFLIHLTPTFLGVLALAIAWKYEQLGSYIFLGLGLATVFAFNTFEEILPFLIISLPLFLCGILFYLASKLNK